MFFFLIFLGAGGWMLGDDGYDGYTMLESAKHVYTF